MRNVKSIQFMLASAILLVLGSVTAGQGTISNQATEMTFQDSVRIPGRVLPPGTYWFTVMDEGEGGGTNRVQVKDANGRVITTMLTQTADQAQFGQEVTAQGVKWPTGKVVLRIAGDKNTNEPLTLLDWYYPGNTAGHRFVYSNKEQKRLDEEQHATMAFNPGDKITVGRSEAAFR